MSEFRTLALASLAGVVTMFGSVGNAQAETIYESTTLVTGTSMNLTELTLQSPGKLSVSMTDVKWPALLNTLSFSLVTPSGVAESRLMGGATSKVWEFDITTPTTLYASIFAKPTAASAGMYSVQMDFAPVPLPAAAWMLISGLAGLLAFRPKQKLSQTSG